MSEFVQALKSGRVLLMDGAMGTELQRLAPPLDCCERLNLRNPELVAQVHRSYLDAGAEVLLTNTFQANPAALARHGLDDSFDEIWRAAIALARSQGSSHFVLADVGPVGNLTAEIAAKMLCECVGVDGILLETWSSPCDLNKFANARVPLLVSFTYSHDQIETDLPEKNAHAAVASGAVAVGVNCGKEIDITDMAQIVRRYRSECDLPTFARPNAGTPMLTAGGWVYSRTPESMASALPAILETGLAVIGGCCGTTPAHVRKFAGVVKKWNSPLAGPRER